jgi:hypothetical protein
MLRRFCVGAERFSAVYRELSRRQVVSVTLLRPEANPCQDHIKQLGFPGRAKGNLAPICYLDLEDLSLGTR